MTQRDDSDRGRATSLLVMLADEQKRDGVAFTPSVALELARMLCHIAGRDGRGVYTITHDYYITTWKLDPHPQEDYTPPEWQ
jgi:hypothetical protein